MKRLEPFIIVALVVWVIYLGSMYREALSGVNV
jgi:hypothetical protein